MNFKEQYRQETGNNVEEVLENTTLFYHENYVEWLEKQLSIPRVVPSSFYVVAKTYETGEDLAQLSIALHSYERAKTFKNSKSTKENYPNAFIVSSLNEV